MARRSSRASPAPRTQSRSAHTSTAPSYASSGPAYSVASPQAAAQPRQPGMFAQMASTAAGVAVGLTIGHTLGAGITSMFGGSSAPASVEQAAAPIEQTRQSETRSCDSDARSFTQCLEQNDGNMQICGYYLQQLKACQEALRQY